MVSALGGSGGARGGCRRVLVLVEAEVGVCEGLTIGGVG